MIGVTTTPAWWSDAMQVLPRRSFRRSLCLKDLDLSACDVGDKGMEKLATGLAGEPVRVVPCKQECKAMGWKLKVWHAGL